jgi:MarR family transcriptional regulator, transcriptional regulator for hemolysin
MAKNNKDSLGTLFQDIARLRVFSYNVMLRDIGLTATQSLVILALLDEQGVIQGDLARTLGIRAVTLGGLVDRMEAKEWLERRPDENDRRAKRIWLTAKGKKLESVIRESLDNVHRVSIEGIPKAQVDQLGDTLVSIRENLLAFKGEKDNS